MKAFIRNNSLILIPYVLLLLVSVFYLLSYDKIQIHVNINKLTGNGIVDVFFKYFTHAGDGITAIAIVAIVLLLNARNGICLLFVHTISGLTSSILKKQVFDVDRPHFVFQNYLPHYNIHYIDGVDMLGMRSFPSGHATTAFAIFMSLAFMTENKLLKFTYFLIAFLAAFSRTYLSQHWMVDITAGSAIGTLVALIFYVVLIASNKLQNLNKPLLTIFNP
jgi:membrane-associated phospholipid phosphatase